MTNCLFSENMYFMELKSQFLCKVLLCTSILFIGHFAHGNSSNSNSGPEVGRSKAAAEAVEANQVESSTTVTRPPFTQPNCSDPRSLSLLEQCPGANSATVRCDTLPAACLQCDFNCTCVYGKTLNVTCRPREGMACTPSEGGSKDVKREMVCQYCYQTPSWQHSCTGYSKCSSVDTPRPLYSANCTVSEDVLCLGRRSFPKRRECDWTAGYHWATALTLSLTLGGFGADRFYLGHWQEGIGKLFSFGGLGVWTIMDVILIAIRYLGPADGSLYI